MVPSATIPYPMKEDDFTMAITLLHHQAPLRVLHALPTHPVRRVEIGIQREDSIPRRGLGVFTEKSTDYVEVWHAYQYSPVSPADWQKLVSTVQSWPKSPPYLFELVLGTDPSMGFANLQIVVVYEKDTAFCRGNRGHAIMQAHRLSGLFTPYYHS